MPFRTEPGGPEQGCGRSRETACSPSSPSCRHLARSCLIWSFFYGVFAGPFLLMESFLGSFFCGGEKKRQTDFQHVTSESGTWHPHEGRRILSVQGQREAVQGRCMRAYPFRLKPARAPSQSPAHLASSLPAPCHEPLRQPGTARAYDVAAPSFKCPLTSARASGRRHDPHRHCSAHMLRTDKRLWRVAAVQGRRCQPPDPPIPLHVQPLRITPVQCAQQLRRERFDQPVADY